MYAGIPAKKIKQKEKLLNEKWWDKGKEWIKEHISDFCSDKLV